MSGTHRDLFFWSKSRNFVWKNHRWGLGSKETSDAGARYAVLHSENHRWGVRPIDTFNFGPKVAILNVRSHRWGLETKETSFSCANYALLHAQNDRWCLGHIEICSFGPKAAILHEKNTDEGSDQYKQVILVLGTLFWMQKITGDVCDP